MEFISLGTIIYDLFNIIRGAQRSDDDPISEKQVEAWIHQYRALLLKRDIDKNKTINPDYVQYINSISLEYDSGLNLYRTSSEIPKTIDFNFKSGLIFIGDKYGNRIQLMPETRVNYQKYNKYSNDDTVAFLRNHRIYLKNSKGLNEISIRGLFQIPAEAEELAGNTFTYDSYYPIPLNMISILKQEILKNELGIEYSSPNDDVNDANNNLESDIEGYKQTYRTNRSV